ncbi:hypothetical protein Ctob_008383 [Chrysochromulina tobinii]|uniref:Uncharacterized protein n=1 Tax=Chrysochromulina tobinii TaxID=1460289 RepID=A0A0M0K562_9EUKA|nr:hypothetical protein Ctob_008383 [Chrysochromulina tobinii]|eukprot:KOO33945.1 hypothetical protein Ctob_008383 [Chrysochromulina sp. CCMP291]
MNAKRDALALVKSSFETNVDILAMMPEVKKKVQNKKDAKGLSQKAMLSCPALVC